MFQFFQNLFSVDFMPHIYCLRLPEVIWLYIASNAVIALAYFCIPPTLFLFIRKRRDIAFSWMFVLFGTFIFACGTTHVLDIVTLWKPVYRFDDLVLLITAVASIGTAILLVKVMPEALKLPNPQQLRDEIDKRTRAQFDLQELNQLLEQRVQERTAALNERNAELEVINQELRYQLELNRAITTQAGDAIFVTDPAGCITLANPEAEKTFGYATTELIGQSMVAVFLGQSAPEETIAKAMTARRTLRDWSTTFTHKDGSAISVSCSAGPLETSQRHSGWIVIARDVTERRKAERALIESEARYRTLVDAMPQLVWARDSNGPFQYFSKQWWDYTGTAAADQVNFQYESVIHPGDVERVEQAWRSSQITGQTFEFEYRIRRHDGVWRWFKTRAVVVPNEGSSWARWLGTCTDIDADKRATAVLEQFNADLRNLASALAHDLHEPLRAVTSHTQLLAQHLHDDLDEMGTQLVSRVIDSTTHMRKLMRDITIYSEAITRPLLTRPVSFLQLVQTVLLRRRDRLDAAGALVNLGIRPDCTVEVDSDFLAIALDHLLKNALAYRRPDEELRIDISSQSFPGEVVVAFSDNGVGIPAEYHERVFQLFKRLHKQHEHPGSGIGLAMCQKIIERHGKTIWVRSDPGHGAAFYFSLPASAQSGKEALHELVAS